MASAQDAVEQIEQFLDNEISLEELEDWSALFVQEAYAAQNEDARRAAQFLRSILNTYEMDQSDRGLRRELENVVRPFASSSDRLRVMVVDERPVRAAMARAAVACLLLAPATAPPQPIHSEQPSVAKSIDGDASDAKTSSSRVLQQALELVEV
jgi:hypothetical protein